jgi:rhamnosyltransferase
VKSHATPSDPEPSVVAVLVLYHQSLEDSPTFCSLSPLVRELAAPIPLLVYDNSPAPVGRPGAGPYPGWTIRYVHDPANPGVSRAYQEGARWAAEQSKRWLLLLDQDTCFPRDWLERYLAAVRRYPEGRLFAPVLRAGERVLSPCRYRVKRGSSLHRLEFGEQSLARVSLLNSGMWVALDDYLAVGGHDLRLALDFSDHEFIDRFRLRHKSFVLIDAECRHDFFASTQQSTASQLQRFRSYCRGAQAASKGLLDRTLTAAVVGARAALLCYRHRSLGFLGIAARSLWDQKSG